MGQPKRQSSDTKKRMEVAQLAAEGKSVRKIAGLTGVPRSTVSRFLAGSVPLVPRAPQPTTTIAEARDVYADVLLRQCETKAKDAVDYLHSVILGQTDDVEQPGCRERITASGVLLTNIGRLRQAAATAAAPAPQIIVNALTVKT